MRFETGNRAAFLARLRRGLATPAPPNPAHPPPTPTREAPRIGFKVLAPVAAGDESLVDVYERIAATQHADVHRVAGDRAPIELLASLIEKHRVATAVMSKEPEAVTTGEALAELGVAVAPATPEAAVNADLAVTSAVAVVATTGSLVVDSGVAGSRSVSLLPPVHLSVVPADRIVATPGDVLRRLGGDDIGTNLVFVSGPSRTADIEQLLTLGVHGPVALHVVLTG